MREITPDVEELHQIIGVGNFEDTGHTGSNTYNNAFRIVDSEWLAAHDAEVTRKTLEDAADELVKRDCFTERTLRILDELAASISTDKAGEGDV